MDEQTGAKSSRFDETRAVVAQVLARSAQRIVQLRFGSHKS
jgi:hypothetical protein